MSKQPKKKPVGPDKVPVPGKSPEIIPPNEKPTIVPEPPEVFPGREPLTNPPSAPPERTDPEGSN